MCTTQVRSESENTGISVVERKRVRGSRIKGYRAAASRTSQANARLREESRKMNSALVCDALWTEVAERNAGELGWKSQST
jgi:hypothetical protein